MTKTLVLILNHNLPDYTRKLHRELVQYVDATHDLRVLDNGSTDTGIYREADFRLEKNIFWGGALNWAFQYVLDHPEYDSLLFLNNDLELNGFGFVHELRRVLFEEDHAVISPCIAGYPQPYTQMQCWGARETRLVRWLDYQAPLFHRKFIEEIGQFHEDLIHGWGQPTASFIACEKRGWTTGVVDWVTVLHYGKAVTKEGKLRVSSSNRLMQKLGFFKKIDREQFEDLAMNAWMKHFSNFKDFEIAFKYGHSYYYTPEFGGQPQAPYVYRFHIINALIQRYKFRSYLEIGVRDGFCYKQIECEDKTGVDPDSNFPVEFQVDSDTYFRELHPSTKFDFIFIDGLHTRDQLIRDIESSVNHLNEGGIILVHDCNPLLESHQAETQINRHWLGTTWKGWVHLRATRSDLDMKVIDTDFGVGIIRKGSQDCIELPDEPLHYSHLTAHRKEWLGLISIDAFKKTHQITDFS
jgi:glycosyltransferase involved in cell wall biosynthesis